MSQLLFGWQSATRRCISSSRARMQEFGARNSSFRGFGQPQAPLESPAEEGEQAYSESSYDQASGQVPGRSNTARFTGRIFGHGAATNDTASVGGNAAGGSYPSKAASSPFPEELNQDYSSSTLYAGAAEISFAKEVMDVLQAELDPNEIEIKPDGAIYLPENRYRKILCRAFGPGGWCLVPRGAHTLSNNVLSREYALFCNGRFVSQARGHAALHGFSNPAMASEVVRSNALMRSCKDLGIGNELWDPTSIANWKAKYAMRRTENGKTRWHRKDQLNVQ